MKRFVYADNAATTKISDAVFDAMLPYLKDRYGNPSSIYALGRQSQQALKTPANRLPPPWAPSQ
jgi:cysteine desulfurase